MNLALVTYLHNQPKPGPYSYFDIGQKEYYSSEEKEIGLMSMMDYQVEPFLDHLEQNRGFKVSLSLSIPVLEYLKNQPNAVKRFNKLIANKKIEILGGQGFDSLSLLYSHSLFQKEIAAHKKLIMEIFDLVPAGYLNASLLYSDALGLVLSEKGFKYAVAPNVPWFIKNNKKSLFRARNSRLRLIVPQLGKETDPNEPALVNFASSVREQLMPGNEYVLLSEMNSLRTPVEYSLPELVAQDSSDRGIDAIVGNSLQKDFLKRLTELSHRVVKYDDSKLTEDFLWIGSLGHFNLLGNKSAERYKIYTKLFTMLYDIEIRTRS